MIRPGGLVAQVPRATEDQGAPLVAQEGDGPAQPLTDDAASEERDNALPVPSRVGVIRNAWDEAVQMMAGRSHEEMVRWVVESVYGKDAVLEVLLVRDASKLQTIYAEIQKLTELSELTADIYSHQIATRADAPIEKKAAVKRRLKGIPTLFNEWGKAYRASLPGSPKKVDVLQLCAARLTHLKEELAREKEAMAVAETPTAIVVFKDRQTASVASQVMLHHDRRFWTVSPAPQPDEVSALQGRGCRCRCRCGVGGVWNGPARHRRDCQRSCIAF